MKVLPLILSVMLLAGCAGMHRNTTTSGTSGTTGTSASSDLYEYLHAKPGDLYFGD